MNNSTLLLALVGAAAVGFGLHGCLRPSTLDTSGIVVRPLTSAAQPAEPVPRELGKLQAQILQLQAQLATLSATRGTVAANLVPEPTAPAEVVREAEIAAHRQYMQGLVDAFNQERVDPGWALATRSTVQAAFDADNALRGQLRTVECRERSCRVEVGEGAGSVLMQISGVAQQLATTLPNISAEHVDQGSGGGVTVLYLTNGQAAAPGKQR